MATPRKGWRPVFLEALAQEPNIGRACRIAEVQRTTAYRYRERNETFRKAWDTAIEIGIDLMEEEARRRAFEGTDKGVYHNGELVASEKQYSDTLAIFLLKAHRPEKYRERHSFDVNAKVEVRTLADVAKEAANGDSE